MRFRTAIIRSVELLSVVGLAQPVAVLETVTIRNCYDSETCRTRGGEQIRLACINTIELNGQRAQPEGLRRITTDRYCRTVGELFVDGMNVHQAMAASSHAEIYWT